MKESLLNLWKREFFWNSSDLNPNKFCQRKDIEKIEDTLRNYFGDDYFEVTTNQNRRLEKTNWAYRNHETNTLFKRIK